MAYGLFGKLPQRRDFVSHGLASAILLPWETWLQSAIGASRAELQGDWERYFLVAPLWRYWIGPTVFGHAIAGVLMASVDQVGRYFPLTLSYVAGAGTVIPPPTLQDHEPWFAALDQRLLSVLADGAAMDPAGLILDLPEPSLLDAGAPAAPVHLLTSEALQGPKVSLSHDAIRQHDYTHAIQGRSYWWMNATPASPPQLVGFNGLPEAAFFARMLLYPQAAALPGSAS